MLVVAVLAPAVAAAQPSSAWNVFFGRTNGTLLRDTPPSGSVKGFTAGLSWNVPITQSAALEIGGAIVQKGGRVGSSDVLLDYIEAPVSLRISDQTPGDGLRAFARIGVAMSVKRKCEVRDALVFPNSPETRVLTSTFAISGDPCLVFHDQGYDAGPMGGVGLVWRDKTLRYTVELRRTDGRTVLAFDSEERVKPSTISVMFGMGWAR
jgi:hypothetical protein